MVPREWPVIVQVCAMGSSPVRGWLWTSCGGEDASYSVFVFRAVSEVGSSSSSSWGGPQRRGLGLVLLWGFFVVPRGAGAVDGSVSMAEMPKRARREAKILAVSVPPPYGLALSVNAVLSLSSAILGSHRARLLRSWKIWMNFSTDSLPVQVGISSRYIVSLNPITTLTISQTAGSTGVTMSSSSSSFLGMGSWLPSSAILIHAQSHCCHHCCGSHKS